MVLSRDSPRPRHVDSRCHVLNGHRTVVYLPDDGDSIVTDGLEGNGTILRAVTGGTGHFRGYVGEQRQEFLGFNSTGGVNLRVTFILRKV